jgi:2',3'-cyclic-nucleotide 2'-phosphodiesterase (5'-nucleotidase family)
MVAIDSTFDAHPDSLAVELLAPYKAKIDREMYRVIGTARQTLDKGRPESPLSNLIADMLRQSAQPITGKPADVAVMNMGGVRNILTAGPITVDAIFEICPFDNALCILTFKGKDLKQLFAEIASLGGEGLSGARLVITDEGRLLEATVGGSPIDDEKLYTLATIDYLAEGNDGMLSMKKAVTRICPEHSILRDLFIRYIEAQTAKKKAINAVTDGRIVVIKPDESTN